MEEQSHKREMSAALRADFQRLRARGVATTMARDELPAGEPVPSPAVTPKPRRRWLRRHDPT